VNLVEVGKMSRKKLLPIGRASEYLGVTPKTLRLAEKKGLLKPTFRTPRGHRRYSIEDLEKIRGLIPLEPETYYISEADATKAVKSYLESKGFKVEVFERGVDLVALKNGEKWVVEVKGTPKSLEETYVQAYIAIGEIIKRMESYGDAYYFIAGPIDVVAYLPSNLPDHGVGVILIDEDKVEVLSRGELKQFKEARDLRASRKERGTYHLTILNAKDVEFLEATQTVLGGLSKAETLCFILRLLRLLLPEASLVSTFVREYLGVSGTVSGSIRHIWSKIVKKQAKEKEASIEQLKDTSLP